MSDKPEPESCMSIWEVEQSTVTIPRDVLDNPMTQTMLSEARNKALDEAAAHIRSRNWLGQCDRTPEALAKEIEAMKEKPC